MADSRYQNLEESKKITNKPENSADKFPLDELPLELIQVEKFDNSQIRFVDTFKTLEESLIKIGDSSTHLLYLLPPALTECRCHHFDRLQNPRRKQYEDEIIQFALKHRFDKESKIFNYLSMGSGGLLQDYVLLYRLITEARIMQFNIVLIEPYCYSEQLDQLYEMLTAVSTEVNIAIYHFSYLDDYIKNSDDTLFDIISASDFDSFDSDIGDIMNAKKLLNQRGLLFASAKNYNYIFDRNKCIKYAPLDEFPISLKRFKQDILSTLNISKDRDTFYCGMSKICLRQLIEVIVPASQQIGYKRFFLSTPNVKSKDQFGVKSFLQAIFPNIEFIYDWINISNTDYAEYGVSPIKPVIDSNISRKIPYDLVCWSTNQFCSLDSWVSDTLKPFATNNIYASTMIIVEKPTDIISHEHWRFHSSKGLKIYSSADDEFEVKLGKLYNVLYPTSLIKAKKSLNESHSFDSLKMFPKPFNKDNCDTDRVNDQSDSMNLFKFN
ncbi:MAG: hypothetical protein A3F14_06625 [Gammaproteobacteria bacterium RIFCSPHIGHO2_12_FULL_43_28]|nr:MAG: hypothetical protein A3F14_06625 [Gammaproteobacteria bacterium RIFCSPHIGHO2_12_FULL_43_28]